MKQFTIFTLGAILAYAYAQPHAAHLKLHEKRALAKREYTTTTEVVDVTTTIDVTVTIYGPSPTSGGSDSQPTSNAAPTSSAGTPNYHANDQIKNVAPNGPGPGGNPSPSPQPQQQPPSSAPQQQPPSSAPQQQQQPTSPAPQQQQQPTSAAAPVAPATSAAPVTSSGGSCGQIGGTCQGDATIYTGGGGACGWTNDTNSQDFFALPHAMMGESISNDGEGGHKNTYCGRMAAITINGKTLDVMLTDKCMGCDGQAVDLSQHAWNYFTGNAAGTRLTNGATWHFTTGPIYTSPPTQGCGNGSSC